MRAYVYLCVRVCLCVGVVRGMGTLGRFPATAQVIKDYISSFSLLQVVRRENNTNTL